jgi:hypothetical protein
MFPNHTETTLISLRLLRAAFLIAAIYVTLTYATNNTTFKTEIFKTINNDNHHQ